MNMKNILSGGLLALAVTLVGCEPAAAPPSNGSSESATPAAEPAKEEPAKEEPAKEAPAAAQSGSEKSGASDVAPPAEESK